MAEAQMSGLTRNDLEGLLKTVIAAAKEPSEAERVKMEKERAEFLRKEKEALELAKTEEAAKERTRRNCPHFRKLKGEVHPAWHGQVNSGDNMVVPVCSICQTEWPRFTADLLPEGGRNGVNFEEWNECNTEVLTRLHKQTFPKGCDRNNCFICYPKDEAKGKKN